MSNKDIVLGFYRDVINGKDFTALDQYYHPDYLTGGLPYIGLGVGMDDSSGDQVVVNYVYDRGPSAGKLEVGDEILFVQDGTEIYETFEDIKDVPWGWGKIDSVLHLRVRRQGNEVDVEVTRGLVEGLQLPLEEFRENWEKYVKQKTPDDSVTIHQIIEAGDMVACLITAVGVHLEYDRQYLVPLGEFFRLKDGKIIETWSVADNLRFYRQMGYKFESPVKEPAGQEN